MGSLAGVERSKAQQAARAAAGPTNKEKSAFVMKHRFLIAKKMSDLTKEQWDDLTRRFDYLPPLRTLWHFATSRLLDRLVEVGMSE